MVDTGFHVPEAKRDRLATYYRLQGDGLVVVDGPDGQWAAPPLFPSGAGGLVTTADDWCAFGRMLLARGQGPQGRVLSEESVALMLTDHLTPAQREAGGLFLEGQGWGFGGSVDIVVRTAWNRIGRYGWVGGTGTAAYVDPGAGTVTVVLSQVELGGPGSDRLLADVLTAAPSAAA